MLISFLRREALRRDETPNVRGPKPQRAAGPAAQSWSARADSISRSIGLVYIAAGTTGLVSVLFPPAAYGSRWLAAVVSTSALIVGVVLRVRALSGSRAGSSQLVLAFATVTVSLGVYAGGGPASGAIFFYVWVTPYAFALFTRRQAAAQAGWMALCSAAVLTLQVHQHPGIGSPSELAGLWFIAVATMFAVGALVRTLSRSLRDVDLRFHRAFRDSQIGAAFVSTDARWLEVNDALCRMLGRTSEELVGESLVTFTAPEDRDATRESVARGTTTGFEETRKRYLRPDGEIVWVALSASLITPETGPPCLFAQYRDITDHKRDRDALAHQAVHDPLTGLFNRTLLLDRLATALSRGDVVGVILLDLDQFKLVNDSLGHHAGDEVLKALAPRLAAATRPTDTLARLGGDEFVVLCERLTGALDAVDRASRLAAALAEPFELSTGSHSLSISIGVSTSLAPTDTAETLLRDADAAMYRAKAAGRGRIELFDHTMRDEALARLHLETDLQRAIERDQFFLEYQPIVEAKTLQPVALEALIRWNHPTLGRLGPDAFIPLAEETGLIHSLGDWVIATAYAQLGEWQRAGPARPLLQIAVNVSPVQLADVGFVDRVAQLLRRSPLERGSLCFEVTERVLLADTVPATVLTALQSLGIRILLDDFGTGYSSLAYLTRFPIDTLKIDQAFIAQLDGAAQSAAIPKAILAIAHELELGAVAEGVETIDQLEQLRALRCRFVQGYAISRPLPADAVPAYLAPHRRHLALTLAG